MRSLRQVIEWWGMYEFQGIEQAQELAEERLWSYIHKMPHFVIGGIRL